MVVEWSLGVVANSSPYFPLLAGLAWACQWLQYNLQVPGLTLDEPVPGRCPPPPAIALPLLKSMKSPPAVEEKWEDGREMKEPHPQSNQMRINTRYPLWAGSLRPPLLASPDGSRCIYSLFSQQVQLFSPHPHSHIRKTLCLLHSFFKQPTLFQLYHFIILPLLITF